MATWTAGDRGPSGILKAVAQLERNLEMIDGSVAHVAANLSHLEPVHMSCCLGRAFDGAAHGILNADTGRSNDLDQSIRTLHGEQRSARWADIPNQRYR